MADPQVANALLERSVAGGVGRALAAAAALAALVVVVALLVGALLDWRGRDDQADGEAPGAAAGAGGLRSELRESVGAREGVALLHDVRQGARDRHEACESAARLDDHSRGRLGAGRLGAGRLGAGRQTDGGTARPVEVEADRLVQMQLEEHRHVPQLLQGPDGLVANLQAHLVVARLERLLEAAARRKVAPRDEPLVAVEEGVQLGLVRRVVEGHVDPGEADRE